MRFSELAAKRLVALTTDGGSARTVQNYDEGYALFRAYLTERGLKDDVREFTPQNVSAYKGWLSARGNKASSVNIRLAALSSLGKWASKVENGMLLSANPVDAVTRPKRQKPREKYLYREELTALQTVECHPCERLVIDAFLETGARVSEIANATVGGLQPAEDYIVLTSVVKGNRAEAWPLSPEFSARLEASLREREAGAGERVFVNTKGEAYKRGTLIEAIHRIALRAGITRIPVRPHVLRHTYNVYGRAVAKLDPVVRAKLLKHSDSSTIQRYDHILPAEEIEARAKVRAALRPQEVA